MKPSNVQNYRPLRSKRDSAHVGLNKQGNLASFCQCTTVDCNFPYCNYEARARLSTPVRALKTRGLHIDGARAHGAHNVPISLIAGGKMWHLVDVKVRIGPIVALAPS
jgi:hypothetical protein